MENLNLVTINKNIKLDSFDCGNKYINDFLKNNQSEFETFKNDLLFLHNIILALV